MTTEAANALYRYFETLYNLNQRLIILCGVDVCDDKFGYTKYIEDVIQAVPRLVPYIFDKKSDDYKLVVSDGLLEFSEEIQFLKTDYESILLKHKDFLEKAKKVRNKLEHKMHGARIIASSSGSVSLFEITYRVTEEEIDIAASEFISFTKDMNTMFSKIQTLVDQFAHDQNLDDHPCHWKLVRYNFLEFNKIYESDLLRTFGKALLPF